MTSINDPLSPDLLFNIFKRLDCIETTRIRRVCKKWFEIIDEHKSFWRILHLPDKSLEWSQSILKLFDRKSDSSLREVKLEVDGVGNFQGDLFQTLKRSRKSLQLFFIFFFFDFHDADGTGEIKMEFLETFVDLETLVVLSESCLEICEVRINRNANASQIEGRQDASSCLKVLWYGQIGDAAKTDPLRFRNLVSLDAAPQLSSSDLPKFLDAPSKTLKHLRVGFSDWEEEERASIPSLDFPRLEIIELDQGGYVPGWVTFPTSITLVDRGKSFDFNLPSISEVWITDWGGMDDVQNKAPILQTLRLFEFSLEIDDWKRILETVRKRWENVQGRLEVDGVQMETIKTLILSFNVEKLKLPNEVSGILEKLRELVENVVDGDSVPEFIDIEIL